MSDLIALEDGVSMGARAIIRPASMLARPNVVSSGVAWRGTSAGAARPDASA